MWRSSGVLLACGLALAGCTPQYAENPITKNQLALVFSEIKWDVGTYQEASLYYSKHRDQDPAFRDSSGNLISHLACGDVDNSINFYVSKVNIELTTTADNTTKGTASVTFPIAALAGTATPSVNPSHETVSTEKIDFPEYIAAPKPDQVPLANFDPNAPLPPIAQALINLRGALILSALSGPCFTAKPGPPGAQNVPFKEGVGFVPELEFLDDMTAIRKPSVRPGAAAPAPTPAPGAPATGGDSPSKDASSGDTVTLGITVTNTINGGITVSAAIVKASVEGTAKSVSGNTVTVTFTPTSDAQFFQ